MPSREQPKSIQAAFEHVLRHYWNARHTETIAKSHPVCAQLSGAARSLAESKQVRRFPNVVVKWSAGQGNWATIPWIAALDSRETARTSQGVYVVYLFRADMSGLYLTLNQGTTQVQADFGREAHAVLRDRAGKIRKLAADLAKHGFDLSQPIRLAHDSAIVRSYEAATIAHRLYARDAVPTDAELLGDLEAVLGAYDRLVPSRSLVGRSDRRDDDQL
jgi:hypothetical protein